MADEDDFLSMWLGLIEEAARHIDETLIAINKFQRTLDHVNSEIEARELQEIMDVDRYKVLARN